MALFTQATKRRMENMLSVVRHMRDNPRMTCAEIGMYLSLSPSGARKYLRDMKLAELIVQVGEYPPENSKSQPTAVFGLNPDERQLQKFVDRLQKESRAPSANDKPKPPKKSLIEVDAGRQLHIMSDDIQYKIRLAKAEPARRDPLHVMLYGNGPAPSLKLKSAA